MSTVMGPILRVGPRDAPGDARLTGPGASGRLDRWCHRLIPVCPHSFLAVTTLHPAGVPRSDIPSDTGASAPQR